MSAIIAPGGALRALLESALCGEVDVITSSILLDELEGCLVEVSGYESPTASGTRAAVAAACRGVEPDSVPTVARDHDGDYVLVAGLAGRVDYMVTRDKDLLKLGS